MKLYTIGCSHTYGDDTALGKDFRQKTWGHKLAKKFDAEWVDTSISGNNNKIICSTIIENLYGQQIAPDYAVVQFTYPTRFWTPYKDDRNLEFQRIADPATFGKFHQPDGSWKFMFESQDSEYATDPDKGTTEADIGFYGQYWRSRISQTACTIHLMSEIKQIEVVLNSLDIPYTFIVWPRIFAQCYNNVAKSIDTSRVLNYDVDNKGIGQYYDMDRLLPTYDINWPKTSQHYKEDGQEFIADALYKHIIAGTKLVPNGKMSSNESFIDSVY